MTSGSGTRLSVPARPLFARTPQQGGRQLFQHFFAGALLTEYQEATPNRLLLAVPQELLDLPWRWLHDGRQFLALYHPLLIFADALPEEVPAPPLLGQARVRILLTGVDEVRRIPGSVSLDKEEELVSAFRDRYAARVDLQVERGRLSFDRLVEIFHKAQPFHIWHHRGPWLPDLSLQLNESMLPAERLPFLLALQQELCCLLIHTSTELPYPSALHTLRLPFVLAFSSAPATGSALELIKLFYKRLLTHDLAIAAMLAQLELYRAARQSHAWSALYMLANTTNLFLVEREGKQIARQASLPASVLMFSANPRRAKSGQQRDEALRLGREQSEIKDIFLEYPGRFLLEPRPGARPKDIARFLQLYDPQIFHFSGHGSRSTRLTAWQEPEKDDPFAGYLAFEKEEGDTARVRFRDLAQLLASYRETLRCAVFNACYTLSLAELVAQYIDCAIGMDGQIDDEVADRFSRGFYRALAAGCSVALAFQRACAELDSEEGQGSGKIPRLRCRAGVDANAIFLPSPVANSRT